MRNHQSAASILLAIARTEPAELVFCRYASKRQRHPGAPPWLVRCAGDRQPGRDVTAPAWITWVFTALVLLLALFSAARLVVPRLRRQHAAADVDIVHVLMGIAMAGMLMPRLSVLPGGLWLAVFAAGMAWFTWHALGARRKDQAGAARGHPASHAVECVAMVYMLLAAGPLGSARQEAMPGMGTSASPGATLSNPVPALLLCVLMFGSALWTIDKLTTSARRITPRGQSATAPRLVSYSKIGMSLAMGYMLLAML